MIRAVAGPYVDQAVVQRHFDSDRAGGEIAIQQLVVGEVRIERKLALQCLVEVMKPRLDCRARVVGDQADEVFVEAEAPKVAGSVDGMEPGIPYWFCVPDVVHETCGHQQLQPFVVERAVEGGSPVGDALHMFPAVRKLLLQ